LGKKKTKQGTKSSQPTTQLVLLDRYIRKQHETVAADAVAATDQLKRKNWVFVCVDFLMTKMSFEGCVCVCVCVCTPPTFFFFFFFLQLCACFALCVADGYKTHKNKTMTIPVKD